MLVQPVSTTVPFKNVSQIKWEQPLFVSAAMPESSTDPTAVKLPPVMQTVRYNPVSLTIKECFHSASLVALESHPETPVWTLPVARAALSVKPMTQALGASVHHVQWTKPQWGQNAWT